MEEETATMKKTGIMAGLYLLLLFLSGLVCFGGFVCFGGLVCFQPAEAADDQPNSPAPQELDDLLAPIALYPDPLLAQILPAATYPTEVSEAAAWLQSGGRPNDIDAQNWDENVKAIAHYPDVLYMMSGNIDWTADLGDAFLNKPGAVTDAIQRLRERASAAGNLANTAEQTIASEDGYIEILPAQPEYMYIPQYDPGAAYIGAAPFIGFGLGLAIGEWLNMDFDWGHHNIIYHGWNRRGWVNKSKPYIHHRSNDYINNTRPFINQKWRHDAAHGDPDRFRKTRPAGPDRSRFSRVPEIRGKEITPTRPGGVMFGPRGDTRPFSDRGRESRMPTPAQQPARSVPDIRQGTPQLPAVRVNPNQGRMPAASDINRVRPQTPVHIPAQIPTQVREPRQDKPSSGAFGGYRGAGETNRESMRGQSSRQSGFGDRPAAAPASRGGSAPGGGRRR